MVGGIFLDLYSLMDDKINQPNDRRGSNECNPHKINVDARFNHFSNRNVASDIDNGIWAAWNYFSRLTLSP